MNGDVEVTMMLVVHDSVCYFRDLGQGRIQDLKLGGVKCGLGCRVPKALTWRRFGADGDWDGEGVSPSPVGVGSGQGLRKILACSRSKWCILEHVLGQQ